MKRESIVAELTELETQYGPARREFDERWHYVSQNIELLYNYIWLDKKPHVAELDISRMTSSQVQTIYDTLSAQYASARNLFTMKWFSVKLKIDKCSEALRLIEEKTLNLI